MDRFDPQKTEASSIQKSLAAATGELESFVENQVREIVDAALNKAAQIEKEAAERAREVQREAERRSKEMLEDAFTRAWRILDGIDLLENGVSDMITTLRREMEGFVADIGSALPAADRRSPDRAPAAERLPPPSSVEDGASTPDNGSASRLAEHGAHVEVEQMIIEQVAVLFQEGRSRAEAERFVMRFKQGEDYLHVLDLIYREDGEGAAAPESSLSRPQQGGRSSHDRRG